MDTEKEIRLLSGLRAMNPGSGRYKMRSDLGTDLSGWENRY